MPPLHNELLPAFKHEQTNCLVSLSFVPQQQKGSRACSGYLRQSTWCFIGKIDLSIIFAASRWISMVKVL